MSEDGTSTWTVLVLTWSTMECFLFAGYRTAWPSLVALYKMDGVYSHLCEPSTEVLSPQLSVFRNASDEEVTAKKEEAHLALDETHVQLCPEQDEAFNFAYTLAMVLGPSLSFALGHLNHLYGLRITRLVTIVFLAIGFGCLAMGSREFPSAVLVGTSANSIGTIGLFVSGNQVSYKFKAKGATAAGLINGAGYAGAGVMPQIFHVAHNHGITTGQCFAFVGSLLIFSLVGTFYVFPKTFFTSEDRKNAKTPEEVALQKQTISDNGVKQSTDFHLTTRNGLSDDGPIILESSGKSSLLHIVASPMYCLLLLWRVVNNFLFTFNRGVLNAWLNHVTNHDQPTMIRLTTAYANTTVLCFPVALIAGSLFDLIAQCLPDRMPYRAKVYLTSAICLGFTSLIGAAVCACAISERLGFVYVMLMLMMVHVVALFCFFTAFLRRMYEEKKFGVLFLIGALATVPFNYSEIPLFNWCENDSQNWSRLYWFLLLLSLSTLAHPVYLLRKARASVLQHQLARKVGDVSKL